MVEDVIFIKKPDSYIGLVAIYQNKADEFLKRAAAYEEQGNHVAAYNCRHKAAKKQQWVDLWT